MVNVGDEIGLDVLWFNARDYLEDRYGRLKLLREWVNDGIVRPFNTYEELADALDQAYENKKAQGAARQRPAFTPAITQYFDQTWGGKRHRRHIVMSSAMREAVYSVTDSYPDRNGLLNTYVQLIQMVRPGYSTQNINTAETELVRILHNNPANLVLDIGNWNSAIGALATNVRNVLKASGQDLFKRFQADPIGFLNELVRGFQTQLQKEIVAFWAEYAVHNPPQSAEDLEELLLEIYDNAAFDLLSNQALPNKNVLPQLIRSYQLFELAESKKSLQLLEQACQLFIQQGLNYPLPYSKVF